jgi:O-acetyl-ADP-ribose deacetylase (regulator of RNase III)
MASIVRVKGDITKLHHQYQVSAVVQQLNCLATIPHGLSDVISKAWPWANVYGERVPCARNFASAAHRGTPGTIEVKLPPNHTFNNKHTNALPVMIGIYGQFDMGLPLQFNRSSLFDKDITQGYTPPLDSKANRVKWFLSGLKLLAAWMAEHHVPSVAFPSKIGCGLAGGDWKLYENLITKDFARRVPPTSVIYIVEYAEEVLPHEVDIVMSGSRYWNVPVKTYFDEFLSHHPELSSAGNKIMLSHGGCRGADKMCEKEAVSRGWQTKEYAAEWEKHKLLGNERSAGIIRNSEMIDGSQPRHALVFLIKDSTGTFDALTKIHKYARDSEKFVSILLVLKQSDNTLSSQYYTRNEFLNVCMKKSSFFAEAGESHRANSASVDDSKSSRTAAITQFFSRKRLAEDSSNVDVSSTKRLK